MRRIHVLWSRVYRVRSKSFVHTIGTARNHRMIRSIIIDSLVQLIVEHGLRSLMLLFRSPPISFIRLLLDILTII